MTPRECREILEIEVKRHHYTMAEFDAGMEELEGFIDVEFQDDWN